MTGVESSGIDATWLLANLEIASVPASADDEARGQVETLVLGPKAFHVAESYVLSESVRRLYEGLQSFLSMRRMEARRRKASALWLRFFQSLARRRQRPSQPI